MDTYKITTEGDCEGRTTSTIGYFTGELQDILKYCEKYKYYELRHEKIKIKHIDPSSVKERQEKENEITQLKNRLKELEAEV
jgi:hypothetical protein